MPQLGYKPIPFKPFDLAAIERAIEQELDQQANEVKREFEKTTSTWGNKPAFTIVRSGGKREIGTDDQTYFYVNEGTGPHTIFPHGGVLAFPSSFMPKTAPGVIGSSGGGRGGAMAFAREVHHPGTKPRKFDEAIAKMWEPKLAKAIETTLTRTIK